MRFNDFYYYSAVRNSANIVVKGKYLMTTHHTEEKE